MRCFIAIDLPNSVREELEKIQKQIPTESNKVNFVKPENIHITLKFLGEIPEFKIELVKKELGEIILKPFTLILDNLGFFPSENYVRVVWVGVKKEEEVVKLYEQVEAKLKGMDFKQDHKFTSHMTLTRVKFLVDRQKFLEQVKKIKVNPIEFKVSSFKLKQSKLSGYGPEYSDLEKFELIT